MPELATCIAWPTCTISLTAAGIRMPECNFGLDNLTALEKLALTHHIDLPLRANTIMLMHIDYMVSNGVLQLVDQLLGRAMVRRRYSDGLHQAIVPMLRD